MRAGMSRSRTMRGRAWVVLLGVPALGLALMAPTCGAGNPGTKAFSKNSLIIPMDACYQGDGTTGPVACPGSSDRGNVLHAYGLVYLLLQHKVPVYWIISPTKSSLTDDDLAIQFNAGAAVGKLDRTTGSFSSPPPNNNTHTIRYRGGPFVVDGTDFPVARELILDQFGNIFDDVNIHVSNVAFSAYAAKTMNGGWSTGGSIPPPIALLNIDGADGKNGLPTVQQYLIEAGLGGITGAGGTAQGPHGTVYDILTAADFCGANPALFANGYRVLWAPHWVAGSANPPGCTLAEIRSAINRFVAEGHDFFSECGSIGSVEGDVNACDGTLHTNNAFDGGRITTTGGLKVNKHGWQYQCNLYTDGGRMPADAGREFYPEFIPLNYSQFSSPFLQIGEFPFMVENGTVADFAPMAGSTWYPTVQHLITGKNDWRGTFDVLTVKPGSELAGTTVYLGGHDYSGRERPKQIAGSRIVLNTLFNLGSSCVTTSSPCQTGQLGVCGEGRMECVNGLLTCVQVTQSSLELCDSKDNDCNGLVDDGLTNSCYDGPAGTEGNGPCHAGMSTCSAGQWSSCMGQVVPITEICNNIDDNCNGTPDDAVPDQACYSGPVGSAGVGTCKAGQQKCQGGQYGLCAGEVLPAVETCGNNTDDNCNGTAEEGCGCSTGDTQPCYGGPAGTAGVGNCHAGAQTCQNGAWGSCENDQRPGTETCNNSDDDCDGQVDNHGACNECTTGQESSCYSGPAGTEGVGLCQSGTRSCVEGRWATCGSEVLPAEEVCDGLDNDCDGTPDNNNPLCPLDMTCTNGVCVPAWCNAEGGDCPEGFACVDDHCVPVDCGAAQCPLGQSCHGGVCQDPCANVLCGPGTVCAGGRCTGGGCYASGCPDGGVCRHGACMGDPCLTVQCPRGTFCREGYCVQSCAYSSCGDGQRCNHDGFCETDPCASQTCQEDQTCVNGSCQPDPCRLLSCGAGLTCVDGRCVDDPCQAVRCPASVCLVGQCFAGAPWLLDGGTSADAAEVGADAGHAVVDDAGSVVGSSSGGSGDGVGDDEGVESSNKCACATMPQAPPWLWGVGLMVFLLRRRQRWLGVLAGMILLSTQLACTGATTPSDDDDDSTTSQACITDAECGAGRVCKDSVCQVVVDAGTPEQDAGPDCETCGTSSCVDLFHDVQHCGYCYNVCLAGEACFEGGCGPTALVAPQLHSISPENGDVGTTLEVQFVGERFQTGAEVHVVRGLEANDIDATVVDGQHLSVTLDLRQVEAGVVELRVVNPDRTISNARLFTVAASTPHIDRLLPDHGLRGDVVSVDVEGSGFNTTSQCKISGPGFPEQGLATSLTSSTALRCPMDLATMQPGVYDVVVVNSGGQRSNAAAFTVGTGTPVLTSITPSSGRPGALLSMDVLGTHFDATSEVHFNGRALNTTYLTATHLFATPVDLSTVAPGQYSVLVMNGGTVASNTLMFVVTSDAPHLTSLNPPTALQGTTQLLQLVGRGFDDTSVIHVFSPSGADMPLTTTGTNTQLSASLSLAGMPAGRYLVEVINAGDLASNALPLEVQSNVAMISSVSPAGGPQGRVLDVRVEGSNFLSGAKVHVSGNGTAERVLTARVDSSSVITLQAMSLAGWETGAYQLMVVNTDAEPSNAVSFTVTPGAPSLTSISPSSAQMGQTVIVTLTGTNFAKPDSEGAGGSTVHAAEPSIGVVDRVLASTVVSSTEIRATLDTTEGISAAYSVTVWNPGGAPPPQKSNSLTFTIQP